MGETCIQQRSGDPLMYTSTTGDGATEAAVSSELLRAVGSGSHPDVYRLHRSGRIVAFGRQDAVSDGYAAAVTRTRRLGFEPVERLAGGRAAVFHEGTLAFSWQSASPDPRSGITERFEWMSGLIAEALRSLGAKVAIGEVPGEYCPGAFSINLDGERKVMGIGQRLVRGAAHVGGVIVVSHGPLVRSVLEPVYESLRIDWDPATVGAVEQAVPGVSLEDVSDAVANELALRTGARFEPRLPAGIVAAGMAAAEAHRSPVSTAR